MLTVVLKAGVAAILLGSDKYKEVGMTYLQ